MPGDGPFYHKPVRPVTLVDQYGNSVSGADNALHDSFGRLRVAGTGQRLDVEFLYNKQPDFFDEITNNGTVTHNANARDLTLSISDANNGTYATMRSHPVPYTPGNSQLIDITGVLDLAGIGGGTAELFVRSNITGSVVTTTYAQSTWDNATSGVDWEQSHILSMDFQSLKVGRIRFALVQNGLAVPIKEVDNDNVRNTGYWQLASLQAYWRLHNTGGETFMEMGYGDESNAIGLRYKITANASATMKAICCTVKSEGGLDLFELGGLPRAIDNAQTAKTVSTTLIPLLSIRTRSTFNSLTNLGITLPKGFTCQTDQNIRAVVLQDPTLTGASWTNVDANNSHIEYDVTASAVANGVVVANGYFASAGGTSPGSARAAAGQGLLGKTVLWDRQGSQSGILTVAAIRTGGTDASVLSTLQWEELR